MPYFIALAKAPVLSVRGALSDILNAEAVVRMRAVNDGVDAVTVEGIGHAPMLDEPDAWDAVLDFLAKVD